MTAGATIVSTPSTSVLIDDMGIYTSPLSFTYLDAEGYTGAGVIVSTATKTTIDQQLPMLEGDNISIVVTLGQATKTVKVEIEKAGQQYVEAE